MLAGRKSRAWLSFQQGLRINETGYWPQNALAFEVNASAE